MALYYSPSAARRREELARAALTNQPLASSLSSSSAKGGSQAIPGMRVNSPTIPGGVELSALAGDALIQDANSNQKNRRQYLAFQQWLRGQKSYSYPPGQNLEPAAKSLQTPPLY